MMNWLEIKDETARLVLEKDALHVYAAVAIQLAAARLSRRTLGHWLPWLAVAALQLGNEALDILLGQEQTLKPWQVAGGIHDTVNTMLMPTLMLLLCRRSPALFTWAARHGAPSAEGAGLPAVTAVREATPGT